MNDKPPVFYWNQSWQDNVTETLMLLAALGFLAYVVKLAFFERDEDDTARRNPPD